MSCQGLSWQQCAILTNQRITSAPNAATAWKAASDWAYKYEETIRQNSGASERLSEIEGIENKILERMEEIANPADLAFGLALAKYLPRLAAILSLASGPVSQGILLFIVPSPIAGNVAELQLANQQIAEQLSIRAIGAIPANWVEQYDKVIVDSLDGKVDLNNP